MSWPDGVWRRLSIEADERGPLEVAEVWWLHRGPHFADIRIARTADSGRMPWSTTQSFGGRASYDAPSKTMEWVSGFDTEDRPPRSAARICPCEGNPRVMREDGDGYTEYWGRVDVGEPIAEVRETPSSLRLEVGTYAITLRRVAGGVVGALFTLDGSEWTMRLSTEDPHADA